MQSHRPHRVGGFLQVTLRKLQNNIFIARVTKLTQWHTINRKVLVLNGEIHIGKPCDFGGLWTFVKNPHESSRI